jgi:PKD repeat protein
METNGSGTVTGSHVYTASGTYTVTLTLTDNDGAAATVTAQVTVTAAALLPDPCHPGQTALFVGGTERDDEIEIEKEGCTGTLEVEIDLVRPRARGRTPRQTRRLVRVHRALRNPHRPRLAPALGLRAAARFPS